MKKVMFFALMAAVSVTALVSCNKEIETPDLGTDVACPEGYYVEELTAVYPHDPETRTAFNETTGRFAWTAGDELAFHLTNGEYVAAPIDPATGKVKLYLPVGVTRDNYAVYPASAVVDDAAAIGNMKVTLPDTYDISADPNTDFVPTPLVATNDAENKHLKFEHVGGLLQVNLNVPAGVKTATVSMGKTISGTFSLEDGTGNGIITPGTSSDEGITFILSEDGLAEDTQVKLLTPLPTGSYEYFKVAYDDGFEFSKDLSATPWNFTRSGGKKVMIAEDNFEAPDYFWFEALEAGSTVKMPIGTYSDYNHRNLFYSFDRRNWNIYTNNQVLTLENVGDKVWFYSTGDQALGDVYNNRNSVVYASQGTRFQGTGKLRAGGELAYLWKKGEEAMVEMAFTGLFAKMTALYDASEIVFPEETADYCYYDMFYGCTNLEQVPDILPAMQLSKSCYDGMFYGCSSLKTEITLPATTLVEQCYNAMFRESGIDKAPIMAFEHTAKNSCRWMFRDCDALVTGPVMHNVDLSESCFHSMFAGCDALVTAPVMPEITTLAKTCYYYMFQNCGELKNTPFTLPATNLAEECYAGMFYGCTSLPQMVTMPRELESVPSQAMFLMYALCKALTDVFVPEMNNVESAAASGMFEASGVTSADVLTTHFYSDTGTSNGSINRLFYNCNNLSEITVYFTTWDYYRSDDWVNKVNATGKFNKPAGLEIKNGDNYIPNGWTVYNLEDLEGGI